MSLPRYFVAHVDDEAERTHPAAVAHVCDTFIIQARGGAREWVVGLSDAGKLTAQPLRPGTKLRRTVKTQLAFHEAAGRSSRRLVAESLYLFEAHLLAHAPDLPGVNDPLHLHGELVGPFDVDTETIARRPGCLTVSRADVLHGLVVGAPAAFLHADTVMGRTTRTFHALLPGDREEILSQGHGGVLAYPLMGFDAGLAGPGNESLVDEILYSVLKAVWRDVARENPPAIRQPDELPVPSRTAHELELISDGFTIEGDRAVRKGKGRMSWLLGAERRRLPPQGNTNKFLSLAEEALELVPGWPVPRITALTARVPTEAPKPDKVSPSTGGHAEAAARRSRDAWSEDWIRRFTEAQDERQRLKEESKRGDDEP